MTFPDDENGHVLRRMLANGDNLAKARDMDFNHIFESEENAKRFVEAAKERGYKRVSYEFEDDEFEKEPGVWGVLVKIFMLPTHAGITAEERKLDSLAREFDGRADGWGSFRTD